MTTEIPQLPAWALDVELEPCDVLFVRGTAWISRQILSASRAPGEGPTIVSHVGMVDTPGTIRTAEILEAVQKVRRTTILAAYGQKSPNPSGIAVARCSSLSEAQRRTVLAVSRSMEGRMYGWGKLPLQLLDSWYGRLVRRERTPVLFRRLGISNLPICSWHVSESYLAAGIEFEGVDQYATPDDVYDAVVDGRCSGSTWSWVLGPEVGSVPPAG